MKSSNPYLSHYDYSSPYADQDQRVTFDDVISKTTITITTIIIFAAITAGLGFTGNIGLAVLLCLIGTIGALITVIVSVISKKSSATITLIYAALEGLSVGGFSFLVAGNVAGVSAGTLIGQAVLGTIGVFLGMLWAYKSGIIKATPTFTKYVMGALVGILVLSLGNLLSAVLFGFNPLRDGGAISIIFSLVCILVASLCFILDFNDVENKIVSGAPRSAAWSLAMGLAITLVWLYIEILKLLASLARR